MKKAKLKKIKNIQRFKNKSEDMYNATREKDARKFFHGWLEQNIDRFPARPYFVKTEHGNDIYKFENINKRIYLAMSYLPLDAMICYSESDDPDELWSIMSSIEYIGYESYDPQKGYYDADRIDEVYTYFKSR